MDNLNGAHALNGIGLPEKTAELFFVTHPKADKPLFGPFLSRDDAECGRLAVRSPSAAVEARQVDRLDELARVRAEAHGEVLRAFIDRQGGGD